MLIWTIEKSHTGRNRRDSKMNLENDLKRACGIKSEKKMGEFKPCASYYKDMDFVCVLLKDISYATGHPSDIIDVFLDRLPDSQGPEFVGFRINRVVGYLQSRNIPIPREQCSVAKILDLFIAEYGDEILGGYKSEIEATLRKYSFEISLSES